MGELTAPTPRPWSDRGCPRKPCLQTGPSRDTHQGDHLYHSLEQWAPGPAGWWAVQFLSHSYNSTAKEGSLWGAQLQKVTELCFALKSCKFYILLNNTDVLVSYLK